MIAFIALGSNQAVWRAGEGLSPTDLVRLAAAYIDTLPGCELLAASGLYSSAPMGPGRQRPYINAVAAVDTRLSAIALMSHLHAIELSLLRKRSVAWQSRSIDLDLIDYDGLCLSGHAGWRRHAARSWPPKVSVQSQLLEQAQTLTVPHPRLHTRAFVLMPLAELCPSWVHPVFKVTVEQLIQRVSLAGLKRVGPFTL